MAFALTKMLTKKCILQDRFLKFTSNQEGGIFGETVAKQSQAPAKAPMAGLASLKFT